MIPLDLLAIRPVRLSYLASIFAFTAQMAVLIALPFYLQPRFTHIAVGLLITGYPLGVLCGAPMSPRLSERFGASGLGMCGLLLTAFGFGALPFTNAAGFAPIIACLAVAGFGMGLFQSPNNHTMMRDAPRVRSGAAAGMMAVCRLLGQTTGALAAALSFREGRPKWPTSTAWVARSIASGLLATTRPTISRPCGPGEGDGLAASRHCRSLTAI